VELALEAQFEKDVPLADTQSIARQRRFLLDATARVSKIVESDGMAPQIKLKAIKKCIESALGEDWRQVQVSDLESEPFDD
jgi:hypothetical protein